MCHLRRAMSRKRFDLVTSSFNCVLRLLHSNLDAKKSERIKYSNRHKIEIKCIHTVGRLRKQSEMSVVKSALMDEQSPKPREFSNKITVVGAGHVGMACMYGLLLRNLSSRLVLVAVRQEKLHGEVADLLHGSMFLKNADIVGSTDFAATAGSKLCIVTAGAPRRVGDKRLDLVQQNVNVYKNIIPSLVKYSPNAVLLIVTNPVDILTYVSWKLSGLPKHQVIGSGTNLDTSRFRFFLSQKLGVSSNSCHAWVIGEHGDSSVPVWSSVNVAGVRLRTLNPKMGTKDDPEKWGEMHNQVVHSGHDIIKVKGYTNWAIGLTVVALVDTIVNNSHNIHPVCTHVKGYLGLTNDICLSLPCVLGSNGIEDVIKVSLEADELEAMKKSAESVENVQKAIKF